MVHIGHGFIQELYGSVIVQAVTGLFLLQYIFLSRYLSRHIFLPCHIRNVGIRTYRSKRR